MSDRSLTGRRDDGIPRWTWIVLLIVTGLLILIGPYLFVSPVDPSDFEATTGVGWEEFSSANPRVAEYLAREARILGIGYMGSALFAFAIVWSRLRRGDPWAARVLWILPLLLALTAVVFLVGDGFSLAVTYGAMAVVVAVTLAAGPMRGSEET